MEILYSDKQIAVCVKPVGLDSEQEVPAELIRQLGGECFPIHRLDKNVGGVMVFARTKSAAAALSKAIQDGTMIKEYVALVHGCPPENDDWSDLLFKDSSKNKVFVVKKCGPFFFDVAKVYQSYELCKAFGRFFSKKLKGCIKHLKLKHDRSAVI